MSDEARLLAVHLHQRSASLDSRERLADRLSALTPSHDLITLSTCHRVEIYAAMSAAADARVWLREHIDEPGLSEATWLLDRDAARHLLRATAGLDSAVVGEGQIAGQVRRAYDQARSRGVHPLLASLFQHALHVARELRSGTALGEVRRSIGSLAVDEALHDLDDPNAATALVIGAGEVGKLAARALARRVGRLLIANRDRSRGEDVAVTVGATAVALDELGPALEQADVVISAADTRGQLLTRALLAPRAAARALTLVDIAVPRSVPAGARELPGLRYRDVDHLGAERVALGPEVVAAAEQRCAREADRLMASWRERAAARTIRALHQRADRLRREHLERALAKLHHLPERDRRVVEGLAASVIGALVHAPTVALRHRPEHEDAARELFGLEEADQ